MVATEKPYSDVTKSCKLSVVDVEAYAKALDPNPYWDCVNGDRNNRLNKFSKSVQMKMCYNFLSAELRKLHGVEYTKPYTLNAESKRAFFKKSLGEDTYVKLLGKASKEFGD
jgi:hypothetical protein